MATARMEHIKRGFPEVGEAYLAPTEFFDYEHPAVRAFAKEAAGTGSATERAIKLFYAVRDRVRYDPYSMTDVRDSYRASSVLAAGAGFCVPKANLLVACARAVGIPAGLGLSDVTNHLCTERLRRLMAGKDLFIHHGWAALHLEGGWVKAAPTFNIELCDKFDVLPTEFDGKANALFQEFDKQGRKHMEYVGDRGIYSDFPFEKLISDFKTFYSPTLFEDCANEARLNKAKRAREFADERPLT
jgi:transglutaminase-like putative cysteine protease